MLQSCSQVQGSKRDIWRASMVVGKWKDLWHPHLKVFMSSLQQWIPVHEHLGKPDQPQQSPLVPKPHHFWCLSRLLLIPACMSLQSTAGCQVDLPEVQRRRFWLTELQTGFPSRDLHHLLCHWYRQKTKTLAAPQCARNWSVRRDGCPGCSACPMTSSGRTTWMVPVGVIREMNNTTNFAEDDIPLPTEWN